LWSPPDAKPRLALSVAGRRKEKAPPVATVRVQTLLTIDSQRSRALHCVSPMPRPAAEKRVTGGRKHDAAGEQPVPIQLFVVRERSGYWEVRLDGRIRSGQPTQMAALHYAGALAEAAAARGVLSKILLFDADGGSLEFPVTGRAVADVA